jgi:phosphatidylinositol dimannoside acyltransferase
MYVLNRAGAPLVSLELAYTFARPIANVFYGLWKSKREVARRNYATVLGRSEEDPVVEQMVHRCFRQFGKYVAEMIHVQGWDTESVIDRLEIEGDGHFEAAESDGKGIIFTSAHMGSTEVAASIVVLRGYRVTSVAEQLSPQFLMDWAVACRKRMGITLLPAHRAGMRLVRTLRRREMVALVVDAGVSGGDGIPVTFFGKQTVFPAGPARLARISGAPIVFGLAARRPGGRFVAHISPPLRSDRKLAPDQDARKLTQRIADIFEDHVRRYPDQWYPFRPMWSESVPGLSQNPGQ